MRNDRLREALNEAHVTIESIVEATGVDPKTVKRWLNGRTPHQRHGWAVARLLHVREDVLWSLPETPPPQQSHEIVAAYAHRTQVPSQAWWHLFLQAHEHIDLLGYSMLFIPEQH